MFVQLAGKVGLYFVRQAPSNLNLEQMQIQTISIVFKPLAVKPPQAHFMNPQVYTAFGPSGYLSLSILHAKLTACEGLGF